MNKRIIFLTTGALLLILNLSGFAQTKSKAFVTAISCKEALDLVSPDEYSTKTKIEVLTTGDHLYSPDESKPQFALLLMSELSLSNDFQNTVLTGTLFRQGEKIIFTGKNELYSVNLTVDSKTFKSTYSLYTVSESNKLELETKLETTCTWAIEESIGAHN